MVVCVVTYFASNIVKAAWHSLLDWLFMWKMLMRSSKKLNQ